MCPVSHETLADIIEEGLCTRVSLLRHSYLSFHPSLLRISLVSLAFERVFSSSPLNFWIMLRPLIIISRDVILGGPDQTVMSFPQPRELSCPILLRIRTGCELRKWLQQDGAIELPRSPPYWRHRNLIKLIGKLPPRPVGEREVTFLGRHDDVRDGVSMRDVVPIQTHTHIWTYLHSHVT